jgi:diadenosine tetraphosphate (Ap4A) HIT family hydrolase
MRSSKQEKLYRKHQKNNAVVSCSFCEIDEGHEQFVEGLRFFKVIKNKFPYTFWDGQDVVEHLMVVPRTHSDSLNFKTNDEKIEFIDTLSRYEKLGYNIYARAPQSVMKSIAHQHTHLIKPTGPVRRFILTIRKPLIRIIR